MSPSEYKKKRAKETSKNTTNKRKEIFDTFVKKRKRNVAIVYGILIGLIILADLVYNPSKTDNSLWGVFLGFIVGGGTVLFLGPLIYYCRGDVYWQRKMWVNIGLAITGFGLIIVIYGAVTTKEETLINNYFKEKKSLDKKK